jgi:hypothetical protein
MDTWGTYTRADGDEVLLQADPINRARYERKGHTFKEYAQAPGVGPALQSCAVAGTSAAEQIWGFTANGGSDLDQAEIVKQAAEVALRKMTGTWTQEEAVAEELAHIQGELKPPETPFAIVQGNVLEGYEALAANGPQPTVSTGPGAPVAGSVGEAGTGTTAPAP